MLRLLAPLQQTYRRIRLAKIVEVYSTLSFQSDFPSTRTWTPRWETALCGCLGFQPGTKQLAGGTLA